MSQEASNPPASPAMWCVYVLRSDSVAATYVGISTDVGRRLQQHNGELPGGAKSTRRGRPWRIGEVSPPMASRGDAQQLEYRIKSVPGPERCGLLAELARQSPDPGPAG